MNSVSLAGPLPDLTSCGAAELQASLAEQGVPAYRARQIRSDIFQRFVTSFDEMTELPLALRAQLAGQFRVSPAESVLEQASADGSTRKALLRLNDGELIETVLMQYGETTRGRGRNTVCVSTQAGCAMNCSFCATGQQGFRRNLSSGEIVAQVLHFARALRLQSEHVTNVVFMGMGEPLANYASTLKAVEILNAADGFGLGARHMTLSTVGLINGIRRLASEPYQVGLALSLHAPNDELRQQLIPTARQPIGAILGACNDYASVSGRRYSVEYALMEGVNDSPQLARDLGHLLTGFPCHVNLIPVNPTDNAGTRRPGRGRVLAFQRELHELEINCTVRVEKGVDIMAGCGQLRGAQAAAETVGQAEVECGDH
jgi:23S rRNA (adenine2503-C2)-methyltransferase